MKEDAPVSLILSSIAQLEPSLHGKELELARYILANAEDVVRMSITELAERSGTSTATVTRFCKSLHFAGYPDFKMKLSLDIARQPAAATYQDIVQGNPVQEIVSAIEANHLRSISDTTQLIDTDRLSQAVDKLLAARRIDLYGVATSGVVAQDFYQKLIRIGKSATAFTDSHMQITSAANLSAGDVAFAISYSGETPETIDALRCAKDRGAFTISLTKYGVSTLANTADIALFSSSLEDGMRRGDMASRIAQLHMIDILFVCMLSRGFEDYVPKLEESYHQVNHYRKRKGRASDAHRSVRK
jgi:DNA-binding MurR/RpiR family transcriptional regulator